MSQAPTRAGLFRDALSKALLRRARPEIRDLYNILEVDFHPLSICQKISPILAQIGADEEMQKYIIPLQQVILTRLFQQLSQVYETVDLEFVESLALFPEPFQVTRATIEKFIMNGNKKGDLAIRMDHATGVLSFDADVFSSAKAAHTGSTSGSAESETGTVQRLQSTPSEIVRSQLVRLAKSLYTTCYYIDPSFNEARIKARDAALARAKAGAEQEHHEILGRKEIIQKRKEKASELHAQREKENAKRKILQEQALQQAEANRVLEEQRIREQKRLAAEREQIRKAELETMIKELKIGPNAIDLDGEDINNLDSNKIRMIKLQQLEREKNSIAEKLRVTGKRIDHLERAFRKEEAKKLPEDYAKQREEDLAAYEAVKAETLKEAELRHKENVELKHRLSRLVPMYEDFRKNVQSRRHEEFEKRRRDAEREFEKAVAARRKHAREERLREKREREEKEREMREAEERAAREKEEQRQREEQRREEMARLREEKEKEREKAKEIAALQLQREEEAMARRKAEKAAGAAAPIRRDIPVAAAESAGPPRLPLAGTKPSWRDRERQKAAGGATTPEPAAAALPVRSGPAAAAAPVPPFRSGTPMERTDSNERPSGPPRIALAGNKPSWRERQAAKEASGGGFSDSGRDTPPAPRAVSGRGIPMDRGEGSARGENGRTASPAPAPEPLKASGAPGKYVPKWKREQAGGS
jgi:translation initiation factor 3 subunit A